MFGFRPKPPVSTDEFEWLLACVAWGVDVLGGEAVTRMRPLVLPESFPRSSAIGHERAAELFEQVKQHAGVADWPCELEVGNRDRGRHVGTGLALKRESKGPPLGTFRQAGNGVIISYNPSQLAQPATLVATFAHELAHYRIRSLAMPPPGGVALEEHATDLTACLLGFGIFMANGAKTFRQFQNFAEQGWEMSTAGYLSELALVTALALFVRLADQDKRAAERELKPYLRGPFRKALAAIDHRGADAWQVIGDIDLGEWS